MNLNLPILDQLKNCKNVLIAGAGGGFDVFAGLPILHELHRSGHNVSLANYSFTDLEAAETYSGYKEHPAVYSCRGKVTKAPKRGDYSYFPEGYLGEFWSTTGYDADIYAFPKVGVKPIREAFQYLVKSLGLDAVILVDGGVDSLMQGDEEGSEQ